MSLLPARQTSSIARSVLRPQGLNGEIANGFCVIVGDKHIYNYNCNVGFPGLIFHYVRPSEFKILFNSATFDALKFPPSPIRR